MSLTWEEIKFISPEKKAWTLPIPPTCDQCGYILTGLSSDRCPECGSFFSHRAVELQAREHWDRIKRLRRANYDAKIGLIIHASGWATIGLARLTGPKAIVYLADGLAVMAALVGIALGCQVFTVRKLPHSLRDYLEGIPPNPNLGIAALLTGLSLIVGGILLPVP